MNRTPTLWFTLLLAACVTHRDYLTELRVQGSVSVEGKAVGPSDAITVELLDTGMDDVRSSDRRPFFSQNAQPGVPFRFSEMYSWGSKRSSAFQSATLTVRFQATGCSAHEREYRLADLRQEGQERIIDVGALTIPCGERGMEILPG